MQLCDRLERLDGVRHADGTASPLDPRNVALTVSVESAYPIRKARYRIDPSVNLRSLSARIRHIVAPAAEEVSIRAPERAYRSATAAGMREQHFEGYVSDRYHIHFRLAE
jgi:hypothetical protein